ncbi:MAG: protein-L-isoaspartate O-methyltransferase [Myxococcota bacterium]
MKEPAVERARAAYAEKIRAPAGIRCESLVRALARVPREDFVGPGPWKILLPTDLGRGYRETPDTDPCHLYDNVLVALDPVRRLNNGEPAVLLRSLDSLELQPGDSFLHVGCGVGYYTAIATEAVRPGGRATGVEIDPSLAERARRNTAKDGDIEIVSGDGSASAGGRFDAIFVNAVATEVSSSWLDSLAAAGRLLLPLTVSIAGVNLGVGWMLLVRRYGETYTAEFRTPVGIYHCAGARSDAGEERLRRLFASPPASGERRLLRRSHAEGAGCALHGADFCIQDSRR